MSARLGKYRIDGVVGRGAMGVVYRAFDPGIARVVALKTIRKELLADSEGADLLGRFRNEARAAGRLGHPHIVTVYDYGEDALVESRAGLHADLQPAAQLAYIAMEFVDGMGLDRLLAPGRPLPPARALAWMGELLAALDYAHARGVVHRDVKPANVLLTHEGRVKITDFGIARIDASTLTHAGALVGTPSHMSPEQFRGDAVDGRSDVFSAAIVLYQMLTGARPFAGSASTVMQRILNEEPAPPSQVVAPLGTYFDAVLARAMAKTPDARYPTARAFHEALLAAARCAPAPDATAPDDDDFTVLLQRAATVPARDGSGAGEPAGLNAWQRDALPDVESSLARQIGPMARYLLKKVACQAEGMDHLTELLLPHIPTGAGREQFQQALLQIRKKLEAGGGGTAAALVPTHAARPVPAAAATRSAATQGIDDAWADATAHKLVAIIGPIGRVLVRRAMKQTGERQALLQLLASHIDNPAERTRFLAEAGA